MAKKILITGESGFIGTHLLQRVREKGDDPYTISHRGKGPRHFSGDILDFNQYNEYDVIYHLAAMTNPRECEADIQGAWRVNVEGTNHISRQLSKGQHIVYASTSHVYGSSNKSTISEKTALHPSNIYGLTKMIGEEVVRFWSQNGGFSYTILRIFHAYGPSQKEGQLVPDVIKKVAMQDRLIIRGSHNYISPVYIKDVIDVLTDNNLPSGQYNLCGTCVSVKEIYHTIAAILGKSNILSEDQETSNKTYMCGSREKILEYKKNWISLEEGIYQTILSEGYRVVKEP